MLAAYIPKISSMYYKNLRLERSSKLNDGFHKRAKGQDMADRWKSFSDFKLLSSQKFLYYILKILDTCRTGSWLCCTNILLRSELNCAQYSSFDGICFFLSPCMITFNPTISNIYHDSPLCIYYLPDFYVKFLSFSDPAQRQDPCTQIQHKDGTPGQCLVTYTEFSVALLLFRCRPKNGSYACLLIETTHCYSNQGLGCY